MYFGETHEEIYEGVKAMNALAKKVGKVFGIIYLIIIEFFGFIMLSMIKESGGIASAVGSFLFFNVICGFAGLFFGTFMGKNYAWGWICYKQKHNTKNLGKDLLNTASHNATVSYLIGGGRMAGWSLISSIVALGLVITVGYWKGFFYRAKYEKLEKKLGKELGKI